jgi:RsiW-degrading membrane proteinase PrsW (M82 family)
MNVVFALLPVILFLIFLFILDSFKLVLKKYLLLSIFWGAVSAVFAYFINTYIQQHIGIDYEILSRYYAPAIEETLKIAFILLLFSQKRVGFIIDAAIYGFAVGAGFALAENVYYLLNVSGSNLLIWIIRGLGTSIMHGGCTALFSLILLGAKNRNASFFLNFLMAFFSAYLIHALFNHFYVMPIVQTLGIIVVLPAIFIVLFQYSEKQLQNWLEIEFTSEIELLKMIHKGKFISTKSGKYLASLKSRFSPEVIVDMYCFIQIYLDLSVKAKRNIMLKECGLPLIIEADVHYKLSELKLLKKQIGKTGELTLAPLIRVSYRDLWKLKTLETGSFLSDKKTGK